MEQLKQRRQELEEQSRNLEESRKTVKERLETLRNQIPGLEQTWKEAAGRESDFADFLKEDRICQETRRELEEVTEKLQEAQKQSEEIQKHQESSEEAADHLRQKLHGVRVKKDEASRQAARYEFAGEGEFVEISLQQMEKEYETLVREQNEDEAAKKRQLEEKEIRSVRRLLNWRKSDWSRKITRISSMIRKSSKRLKADGERLAAETIRFSRQVEQVKEAKGKAESKCLPCGEGAGENRS